jgi:hypothetical protein
VLVLRSYRRGGYDEGEKRRYDDVPSILVEHANLELE